jgi:hypothetical protein
MQAEAEHRDARWEAVIVTAWGNALLAGAVPPDAVADVLGSSRHRVLPAAAPGEAHIDSVDGADSADSLDSVRAPLAGRAAQLAGDRAPVSLSYALSRARAAGVRWLRLVLPAPGDATGLPGPVPFNQLAVAAGVAILVPQAGLGLLPGWYDGLLAWSVHPVATPPSALPDAASASADTEAARAAHAELRALSRQLTAAISEAADTLVALDVAGATPDQLADLAHVRAGHLPPLPPGHPREAVRLAQQALTVLRLTTLARAGEGAARSASAIRARQQEIAALDRIARTALAAAVSVPRWEQP